MGKEQLKTIAKGFDQEGLEIVDLFFLLNRGWTFIDSQNEEDKESIKNVIMALNKNNIKYEIKKDFNGRKTIHLQ